MESLKFIMKATPRITDTQWEIMRLVWAQHPITATELIEQLNASGADWHPKTTRTLLSRLVEKKALRCELRGRGYVYEPLVTERECVAAASESFVDRVFGGSLKPLFAHFVEQRRITKEDLRELSELLEGRTGQNSNKSGRKS